MDAVRAASTGEGEPFSVGLRADGATTVLTLRGELDIAGAPRLARALAVALATGCPVVIDLSRLAFIDVGGLSLIAAARRSCRIQGRVLSVRRPQPQVGRLLELVTLA